MNGVSKDKIFIKFLSKKLKKFLSDIKECFKISPYPQTISLFGSVLKKILSLTTNFG